MLSALNFGGDPTHRPQKNKNKKLNRKSLGKTEKLHVTKAEKQWQNPNDLARMLFLTFIENRPQVVQMI